MPLMKCPILPTRALEQLGQSFLVIGFIVIDQKAQVEFYDYYFYFSTVI